MKTMIYMIYAKSLEETEILPKITDEEFIQRSIASGWRPISLQDFVNMWNNDEGCLYHYLQSSYIRAINE